MPLLMLVVDRQREIEKLPEVPWLPMFGSLLVLARTKWNRVQNLVVR